jgi:hypothetical protein
MSFKEFIEILDLSPLFYLVGISLILLLAKWHNSSESRFDFRAALLDPCTNTISFSRLGHFVALVISTAIIIHETAAGRLSEWLFAGYMIAYSGTYIWAKQIDAKALKPPSQS